MEYVKFFLRWFLYCIYWPPNVRHALLEVVSYQVADFRSQFKGWTNRHWIIFEHQTAIGLSRSLKDIDDALGRVPFSVEHEEMKFEVFFDPIKNCVRRGPISNPVLSHSLVSKFVTETVAQYNRELREREQRATKRKTRDSLITDEQKRSAAIANNAVVLYRRVGKAAASLSKELQATGQRIDHIPMQIRSKSKERDALQDKLRAHLADIVSYQAKLSEYHSTQAEAVVSEALKSRTSGDGKAARKNSESINAECSKLERTISQKLRQRDELQSKLKLLTDRINSLKMTYTTTLGEFKKSLSSFEQRIKDARAFCKQQSSVVTAKQELRRFEQLAKSKGLSSRDLKKEFNRRDFWQFTKRSAHRAKDSELKKIEILVNSSRIETLLIEAKDWIRQTERNIPR